MISSTLAARFWAKVKIVDTPDACWLWTGARSSKADRGLLRAHTTANFRPWEAPRVAWLLTTGDDPGVLLVCHHCDVPRCVRFDHLFLGTAADNREDGRQKGRLPYGDGHVGMRLLNADVWEIRRRLVLGERVTVLARRYSVSHSLISRIRSGRARQEVA